MLKSFEKFAAFHGLVCSLMAITLAFGPLYTVHVNAQSIQTKSYEFECYFLHASFANSYCEDVTGFSACYKAIDQSMEQCQLVQLEDTEAYTFVCSTAISVIVAIVVLTTIIISFIAYVPEVEVQADTLHKMVVLLHLLAAAAGLVIIHQTMSILDHTKYNNSNGHGQYPDLHAGTYIVTGVPLTLLFLDNLHDL